MMNRTQPHKADGDTPLVIGTRVYVTDYVFGGRMGVISAREDSDDPESYGYFVYLVAIAGCGDQYLNEYQCRAEEK